MPKSLLSKVALLFAIGLSLISLVILLGFSSESYNRNKELFIQRAAHAASELAYKTERLLQLGLFPREFLGYEKLCQDLVNNTEGVSYTALLDNKGDVVFQAGDAANNPFAVKEVELIVRAYHNEYVIIKSLKGSFGRHSLLVVVVDQRLLEDKLISFAGRLLLYAVAVILVGVFCVIYYLRRNLGRPVNSLVEHIQNVDFDSPPDQNWELLNREDELSIVARAFDQMLHRLSHSQRSVIQSNRELRKLTGELELRVAKRTAELQEANGKLHSIAHTDLLTGFANRRKFEAALKQRFKHAERHRHNFSILMADLDGFKEVNDVLGHAAGDYALRSIGLRILSSLRGGDSVFRVGGDEFVFIIEEYQDEGDLIKVVEKIKDAVKEPILYHENQLTLGISIGIACAEKEGDCRANELLLRADKAMYKAKKERLDYVISEPV